MRCLTDSLFDMLRTHVCDLLRIEYPVIQAPSGCSTNAELVAAVSNAGGLGSLAIGLRPAEDFKRELARLAELTARPFAVNHPVLLLDEQLFGLTLKAKPAVISFATDDPGWLVERAHAASSRVIQQIHTVKQAVRAAERGVYAHWENGLPVWLRATGVGQRDRSWARGESRPAGKKC